MSCNLENKYYNIYIEKDGFDMLNKYFLLQFLNLSLIYLANSLLQVSLTRIELLYFAGLILMFVSIVLQIKLMFDVYKKINIQ